MRVEGRASGCVALKPSCFKVKADGRTDSMLMSRHADGVARTLSSGVQKYTLSHTRCSNRVLADSVFTDEPPFIFTDEPPFKFGGVPKKWKMEQPKQDERAQI